MVQELGEFLAGYPLATRPTSRPEPLSGGLSGANLWMFDSPSGRLVARSWPPEMLADRLARIHAWLDDARPLAFVATPWKDLQGGTIRVIQGRCWELSAWKPGTPDLLQGPDPARLSAAGTGLAALHARLEVHGRFGPSPGLAQRAWELAQLVAGGLDRLAESVGRAQPTPLQTSARAWLGSARTRAQDLLIQARTIASRSTPIQPCLQDARPDHFLFQDNDLTGLIDFGAMEIDTVAIDLARLFREIPGLTRSGRIPLLDAYQTVRHLDPATLRLIEPTLEISQFLTTARWLSWRYLKAAPWASDALVASRLHWSQGALSRPESR